MNTRNRSDALSITTNQKKRISSIIENEISNLSEEQSKEKIFSIIEEKIKYEDKFTTSEKTVKSEYTLDFQPPAFLDIRKEYYTKDEKVIFIL
jgi:hypothetical protein